IHPAQSESVAWVAAYVNSLSAVFIFAAILSYLRARPKLSEEKIKLKWLMIGSAMYALALLTKEVSIVVPLIIAAYELVVIAPQQWRSNWRERLRLAIVMGLPFAILTIAYLALRIFIFGVVRSGSTSADFPEMGEVTPIINLLTLPTILLNYIKIVLWPFALKPIYAVEYTRAPQLWNFFVPTLLLILIIGAGIIIARRSRLTRIGFIWAVVPILPMLDIRFFNREMLVQDRYLYLSLVGA